MADDAPKPIAYEPYTVARESLPFPVVLYPGHYGTFFAFRKSERSPIVLCACAREGIENYARLRLLYPGQGYQDARKMLVLRAGPFPYALVDSLMSASIPSDDTVTDSLEFRTGLCHECNGAVPKYRYCHEMYGGAFKQTYGWYINKQAYEFGLEPLRQRVIPEICPQEVLQLLKLDPVETPLRYQQLVETDFAKAQELEKELQKQKSRVWNVIENEVRQKLGFKRIGEGWTSETVLYYLVRSLYPSMTIHRHYRPDFLEGLELDIFIEEPRVGIEYQGIQHFEPVEHWGGDEGLQKRQANDRRKREICESLGIPIVYFRFDEPLTDDFVRSRLDTHIQKT